MTKRACPSLRGAVLTPAVLVFPILVFSIQVFSILPAGAEERPLKVEVSYDGLEVVEVFEEPAARPAVATAKGAAIFGATPDWSNDFRIQVGGLQAVDVNGDQLVDVVVGCYTSNSFPPYPVWRNYIYLNTGSELEATPSWTSSDEVSTGDVQVADVDGDTYPDVVAINGGFAMSPSVIYFGSESGPSTTPGWSSGVSAWANYGILFDVDHDDFLELVTANQGNSQQDPYRPLYYFENVEGTLATTPSWQSAESSIQNFLSFADMDGDGWEDLAVSKWSGFESGVYKNVMGTLETAPVWTTGDTDTDRGVGWAYVDGDSYPELALGHDPTRLYANTMGTLGLDWSATGSFFGQQDLRWHDVDADGDPDLAEIHFSNGVVNLYLNHDGVLDTAPSWSYDSPGAGTALAFGDVDGDGAPDLVVGNSGDVSLMVFYNQLDVGAIFADGFESGNLSAWSSAVP